MKFVAPNSYTNDPGILTLEEGDPPTGVIRRIFEKNGLKLTQKTSLVDFEVTVLEPTGFLKGLFISIMSQATYILMQSDEAIKELKKLKQ